MNGRQIIPTCFTLAALCAAFLSIVEAASGNCGLSGKLILLSLILDGLDGNVARWIHGESDFGADLDTFVDITAFGIAPALLAYQAALHQLGLPGLMLSTAIVVSGAMRLARFRILDPYRGQQGFLGMPITVNATWVALLVFVESTGLLDPEWFSLTHGGAALLIWGISAIFLILQISGFHYSKPSKEPVLFFAGVLLLALVFCQDALAVIASLSICLMAFCYAFVSPFMPRHTFIEVDVDEDEDNPFAWRNI